MTKYNLPNLAFLLFDQDLRYILAAGDLIFLRLDLLTAHLEGHYLRDVIVSPPKSADWLEPAYRAALVGDGNPNGNHYREGMIMHVRCSPFRDAAG